MTTCPVVATTPQLGDKDIKVLNKPPKGKYKVIGLISAGVPKTNYCYERDLEAAALERLKEKAAAMGADALINVHKSYRTSSSRSVIPIFQTNNTGGINENPTATAQRDYTIVYSGVAIRFMEK